MVKTASGRLLSKVLHTFTATLKGITVATVTAFHVVNTTVHFSNLNQSMH